MQIEILSISSHTRSTSFAGMTISCSSSRLWSERRARDDVPRTGAACEFQTN
jgi:hypothetical protein